MIRIAIVIFNGFDELDAIAPYEVFRHAAKAGAPIEAKLVTLAPAEWVTAANGLELKPQGVLEHADWIVVPGGGYGDRADRGAWGEIQRGALPQALARLHGDGARLASVCTGAMLLSAAGLTRGRPATTHHVGLADLEAQGARLVPARVVDDGDIVTAGGITSGIDLALWLVERLCGADAVRAVSEQLEYERRGPVHVS